MAFLEPNKIDSILIIHQGGMEVVSYSSALVVRDSRLTSETKAVPSPDQHSLLPSYDICLQYKMYRNVQKMADQSSYFDFHVETCAEWFLSYFVHLQASFRGLPFRS